MKCRMVNAKRCVYTKEELESRLKYPYDVNDWCKYCYVYFEQIQKDVIQAMRVDGWKEVYIGLWEHPKYDGFIDTNTSMACYYPKGETMTIDYHGEDINSIDKYNEMMNNPNYLKENKVEICRTILP